MKKEFLIAIVMLMGITANCQQDDKYNFYRAIYSNTILTDGRGGYAEHGAWKKVDFIINLGDSDKIIVPNTPGEEYRIKKDIVYYDSWDDLWIKFKCWDKGNNVGQIRIESYNVSKPLHWDGETIIASLYIDFPEITYVYKLKANL